MSRKLVQISLLTLLVATWAVDVFALQSDKPFSGDVIGNDSAGKTPVIQQPVRPTSDAEVSHAFAAQPPVCVTVIGQVTRPGVYEFRNGAPDLKELIEQVGGLRRYCPHQFYVFKATEEAVVLDGRNDADYQFDDGDILLAETSKRYYRALGAKGSQDTLKAIHPTTQMVLLNVLDRPVFLSLPSEQADLPHLLGMLNQDRAAFVGVERIEPPNASAIPEHALIAPDMIFSGSILKFVPGAINRQKLPSSHLPDPVAVNLTSKVQAIAGADQSAAEGWSRKSGKLKVQPVNAKAESPFAPNLRPSSDGVPTDDSPPAAEDPFADAFAQFEVTAEEALDSDAPEVLTPEQPERQRPLLSTQQWRIIVTFVTLLALFLSAWYIRHRQQKNGNKTFTFVESKIGAKVEAQAGQKPTPSGPEQPAPGEIAEIADSSQPAEEVPSQEQASSLTQSDEATTSGAADEESLDRNDTKSETPEAVVEEKPVSADSIQLSSYNSNRDEDFIDEKTYEVSLADLDSHAELEVFDQVELPSEPTSPTMASLPEESAEPDAAREPINTEAHHLIESIDETPASRVQQSILGTPWIQELAGSLNPHESDISVEEQPEDAPEAETEEAKPQTASGPTSGKFAAQQLRIDQAHITPEPAKAPEHSEPSPEAADSSGTPDGPSSAAPKWLRMEDPPRPPEENLDHIFQAIMRERNK